MMPSINLTRPEPRDKGKEVPVVRWPSVKPLAPIVAGSAAFILGGIYHALLAGVTGSGAPPAAANPILTFGIALVTRIVVAYGLALIVGVAGITGAARGALIGVLACIAFVVTISLGQAAFGLVPWTMLPAGLAEPLLGYALMGAIVSAWPRTAKASAAVT